jgi:hypothetical protein
VKRPGGGDFSVLDYDVLLGRRALAPIKRGYQIKQDQVATDFAPAATNQE